MGPVPEEMDVGAQGLVLRRWRLADAEPLLAAIEMSLAELRRFMPWAMEPPNPASIRTFLEQVAIDAPAATAIGLALVDSGGDVVGGFGLTDGRGPGILEIGYWIRSDRTGRGYATAGTRAMTEVAFDGNPDVDRVEIRCDPANVASAAIPAKLGFRLDRTDVVDIEADAQTGRQQVWVLTRADRVHSAS
jgi:RimJ/RimL family protein N-acetyltransferase